MIMIAFKEKYSHDDITMLTYMYDMYVFALIKPLTALIMKR